MTPGISRETFEGMDPGSKLNVLYDYASDAHKYVCETQKQIEALEKKVDRRKKFDTSMATGAGLVGGFVAHFIGWIGGGKP
jgi:hypothetical protein